MLTNLKSCREELQPYVIRTRENSLECRLNAARNAINTRVVVYEVLSGILIENRDESAHYNVI